MLYGLPEWKDGVIQRKAGTGEKDALLRNLCRPGEPTCTTGLAGWLVTGRNC